MGKRIVIQVSPQSDVATIRRQNLQMDEVTKVQVSKYLHEGKGDLKECQGEYMRALWVTDGHVKNLHATIPILSQLGHDRKRRQVTRKSANRPTTGSQGEREPDKTNDPE